MLCPLAVEHYLGLGEDFSQLARAPGVVEVDVGGDNVFGAAKPQFFGGLLDSGDEHSGTGFDYGATAVFNKINGEDSVNAGNFFFQAIGFFGDGFQSSGFFFLTSKN